MSEATDAVRTMRETARKLRGWAEASAKLAPEVATAYASAMTREANKLELAASVLEGEITGVKREVA